MSQYHIRPAGLEDIDIIVRHRVRMFQDMGTPVDVGRLEAALHRGCAGTWRAATTAAGWPRLTGR